MLKKLLIAALSLSCIPAANALSIYVAPMLLYQGYKAGKVDFEGIFAQLALGAGSTIRDYPVYLGAEIFVDSKPITIHNHKVDTSGLKPGYTAGASLIPGVCLDNEIMLYARLGIAVTNFQSLNTSKHGYQAGIGLAAKLTQFWDVRGEYVYSHYNSISGIGAPRVDQFGIGLIYQFA